jgi:anti-anti-sigma factor
MLRVTAEGLGDVSIVHCEGRIVQSDSVFLLRDKVRQQRNARVILLDFTDVDSLGGGGLGMLVFLQRWTREREIQLQIFDPPYRVRRILESQSSDAFTIIGTSEVMCLLGWDIAASQPNPHPAAALVHAA